MFRPIATLVALAIATTAAAQQAPTRLSTTTGLIVGASVTTATLSAPNAPSDQMDDGTGFGVEAAYGFTPRIAAVADFRRLSMVAAGTDGQHYTLQQFDVGPRFYFRQNTNRVRPYVDALASYRAVALDVDVGTSHAEVRGHGIATSVMGGILIAMTDRLAFDVGVGATLGKIDQWTLNGQKTALDDGTSRVDGGHARFGLTWTPTGKR